MGIRAVHVGDLDGDGDPDVLAASYDAGTITWCVRKYAYAVLVPSTDL
jgi:hypothetical protein